MKVKGSLLGASTGKKQKQKIGETAVDLANRLLLKINKAVCDGWRAWVHFPMVF